MLQSLKFASAAILTALSLAGPASAAELGAKDETIKLAINEWTGQHISTHIAGEVLRTMGYDMEYVTAGNYPQHTALADGDLHATIEVWTNNVAEIYPKMKEAGKIVDIGPSGLATREGWMYLEGQLVGMAVRPARAVVEPVQPTLLVSVEYLVSGDPRNAELTA